MEAKSRPLNSPVSKWPSYKYNFNNNAPRQQRLSFRRSNFSISNIEATDKPPKKRVKNYLSTLSWNRIQHNEHNTHLSPEDEKVLIQNETIWSLLGKPNVTVIAASTSVFVDSYTSGIGDENDLNDHGTLKMGKFPSSEYSEWGGNIFETDDINETQESENTENHCVNSESMISANTSYNFHVDNLAPGVAIYKTRSRFNKTFQRHFNKFHKMFQDLYEAYQRKKTSKANSKNPDSNDPSAKINDGINFDSLPEDAFTCYNQFRTQNFNEFFETFPRDNNIPTIGSINELTYEKLKDLRDQFFNLSFFSSESNLELPDLVKSYEKYETDNVILDSKTSSGSSDKESKICEVNEDELMEALTGNRNPIIDFYQPADKQLCEMNEKSTNAQNSLLNLHKENQPDSKNSSDGNYQKAYDDNNSVSTTPQAGDSGQTAPDIVRQIFHSSISGVQHEIQQQDFMNNCQLYQPTESESSTPKNSPDLLDENLTPVINSNEDKGFKDDIFITDFDHVTDPVAPSDDDLLQKTAISAGTFSSFGTEPLTSMSVLKRVRSVFTKTTIPSSALSNTQVETRSSSENSSNYTPVSVVVPALKPNNGFIADLAGSVSDGRPISSIYHDPETNSTTLTDDNAGFDIRHPIRFFTNTSETIYNVQPVVVKRSRTPSIDIMTTIKFDKFAHLLLYDGSKRLRSFKYQRQMGPANNSGNSESNSTLKLLQQQQQNSQKARDSKLRQEMFKNNGTLVLGSANSNNSMNRLKNIKLSKFSSFSTLYGNSSFGRRRDNGIERIIEDENDNFALDNDYFEEEEATVASISRASLRSILKSKLNRNAEAESMRATYCDDVEVDDFMTFFENHERKRQESEPYLERVREKQLLTYYALDDENGDNSPVSSTEATSSAIEYS